jgi:hypothetical protein
MLVHVAKLTCEKQEPAVISMGSAPQVVFDTHEFTVELTVKLRRYPEFVSKAVQAAVSSVSNKKGREKNSTTRGHNTAIMQHW